MSARRTTRTGPRALDASAEARRRATVILETLTGLRTTQEAADALGITQPRYYQLETYALQGLVEALEPRPRGRRVEAQAEIERQRGEIARLEREVCRQRALYRTTQRALGVPASPPPTKAKANGKTKTGRKKKARRRRRTTRGERIVSALRGTVGEATPASADAQERAS